jgi:phosphatidylserine/phosphatidylglycerophosphate/cardiolipin synthase-like enzyme
MIVEEPPFYGTWKGRILEAIAVENIRDWNGIWEYTQLQSDSLNKALSELYNLDVITRQDDNLYWIEDIVLLHQYRDYFDNIDYDHKTPLIQHEEPTEIALKRALPKDENLANFVVEWRAFKNLSFSLDARHFFLEGTYLDDLSKDLIRRAKKEVLLVNPFVVECNLSNTLIDAIKNKAKVIVITRNPSGFDNRYDRPEVIQEKQKYHETLTKEGVTINYEPRIHAKLIVVDNQIAIISSMNFVTSSSGGSSWEAGMISIDDSIVNSVHNTIHDLLKKF